MVSVRRGSGRRPGGQGLLTILFTDLAGSTALTQRVGDARAQEVMRAHNTIVRREVGTRGGTEIKHTGDGIMATFPSAVRAVASAVAIQRGVLTYSETHPEMAFAVKIGLNAGEPIAEDADVRTADAAGVLLIRRSQVRILPEVPQVQNSLVAARLTRLQRAPDASRAPD